MIHLRFPGQRTLRASTSGMSGREVPRFWINLSAGLELSYVNYLAGKRALVMQQLATWNRKESTDPLTNLVLPPLNLVGIFSTYKVNVAK